MSRAALERAFKAAQSSDDFSVHLDFKAQLLAWDSPDAAGYHFELLKRTTNDELLEVLARFFAWRGKPGETYLVARLTKERDPFLISIALQILGVMRSKSAAALARGFMAHASDRVRERACIVLGWVGNRSDLPRLRQTGLHDRSANVRKWAATQQMHICLRSPAVKPAVVAYLREAIESESDPEVIEMIIATAQEVLKRRFGLKSDTLAEAKRKATVALTNFDRRRVESARKKAPLARG